MGYVEVPTNTTAQLLVDLFNSSFIHFNFDGRITDRDLSPEDFVS